MRILQLIQKDQRRGAEIFACQLSELLISQGHEVTILVIYGERTRALEYEGPIHFLMASDSNNWMDWPTYRKLGQLVSRGAFDIVQANAGDTLRVAALSKKIFGWSSLLVFRNANKMSEFMLSPLKKAIYRWLVREVDAVASVSKWCKQDFEKLFPRENRIVAYLPIGVSFSAIEAYTDFAQAGFPSFEGPVLLHVGSFVGEKNHEGLLRIFVATKQECPSVILLLAGDGPLKAAIEAYVQLNNIEGVVFAGNRKDILKLMPLCAAMLLPSKIEGLPGTILESFLSKIPVVAYNVGGISEVVIDGTTGYLVEPGDEQAFARKTLLAINNRDDKMLFAANQLVRAQFDNEKVAYAFSTFYQSLISNHAGRGK